MSGPTRRETSELQHGTRLVADLTGAGNVTREAVVTAADPRTGRPLATLEGIPSPFEILPTVESDATAGATPLMARALVIDPGSEVVAPGSLGKPARVKGLSTVAVQADDGQQAPINHILRIIGKRLAFLAETDREGPDGLVGLLAWEQGANGRVTRIADFWAPMGGQGREGVVTGMRGDAVVSLPGGQFGWPLALSPTGRANTSEGSRISRGWLAVGPDGAWCPETPIPDEIPEEDPPPPEGDGKTQPPQPPRTCFVAGTPVAMADGTERAIERISFGDRVAAFTADGAVVEGSVVAVIVSWQDATITLTTTGGRSIQGTAEHPFAVRGGSFVRLGDLRPGDVVLVRDGAALAEDVVKTVGRALGRVRVWNLTVDGPHTYFAGGFAVHNKSRPPKGGGGVPEGKKGEPPPEDGEDPAQGGLWGTPQAPEFPENGDPPDDIGDNPNAPGGREEPPVVGDGELTPCNKPPIPILEEGGQTIKGGGKQWYRPPGATKWHRMTIGSRATRASPRAGLTVIRPPQPRYDPDGDERQRLGGGPYMRGMPLVPRGGIRLTDAYDFAPGHTTWDVLNHIIKIQNQLISFVNDRLPFAPDVHTSGAIRLPPQKAEEVRLEQYDEGAIVSVEKTFRGRKFLLPHAVRKDRSGRRRLDQISSDATPERTLGTGERGADILIRYATGETAHRSRRKVYDLQPKMGWDGTSKRLVATGAALAVDSLETVAEDSSENEIKTTEAGVLTVKGRVNGAETTRTLPLVGGTIPVAPSITADALPKWSGTTGAQTPSAFLDDGVKNILGRDTVLLEQKVVTVKNGYGGSALLTIQGGDGAGSNDGSSVDIRAGTCASGTKGTTRVKDADGTTRVEVPPNDLAMLLGGALRLSTLTDEASGGTYSLTETHQSTLFLYSTGSAQDVVLEDAPVSGRLYMIKNVGSSGADLVVKDFGGSTVATLSDDEWSFFVYDATTSTWRAFGLF